MTRDMGIGKCLLRLTLWQNPFSGTGWWAAIRRECLDHVMVWNERSCVDLQKLFFLLSAKY